MKINISQHAKTTLRGDYKVLKNLLKAKKKNMLCRYILFENIYLPGKFSKNRNTETRVQ